MKNPYKPGAGHAPPFLAGRQIEENKFKKLLTQKLILKNLVLTGLRGVGKTVLLDRLKYTALKENWFWVGTDLSEAVTVNEQTLVIRLLTDLSMVTSKMKFQTEKLNSIGFASKSKFKDHFLNFTNLQNLYEFFPGLPSDKLKGILELTWETLDKQKSKNAGIIFAYDEAQTMSNHPKKEQYPLSLLMDVFQSIQRKEIPFMVVLTGLPTLFPKMVEARTFTERMFEIAFLGKLNKKEAKQAITKPTEEENNEFKFNNKTVEKIVELSDGYPYFIQYFCKEVFDVFLQQAKSDKNFSVPVTEILAKLDRDFFSGRWENLTARQKELLMVIAHLDHQRDGFKISEIFKASEDILNKPFSTSHINQILQTLCMNGIIFRNRHGLYSFAVPLMDKFILRLKVEN